MSALLAAGLAAYLFGHHAPPAARGARPPSTTVTSRHERVGQWLLTVTRDPFAQTTVCDLRGRSMLLARGAMTFYFGGKTETLDALYKVDDGRAVSWRVNAVALAASGALTQSEDLANPSGGRVAVPVKTLAGARYISIRPSLHVRARVYSVADLPAALARADADGCGPGLTAAVAQ